MAEEADAASETIRLRVAQKHIVAMGCVLLVSSDHCHFLAICFDLIQRLEVGVSGVPRKGRIC